MDCPLKHFCTKTFSTYLVKLWIKCLYGRLVFVRDVQYIDESTFDSLSGNVKAVVVLCTEKTSRHHGIPEEIRVLLFKLINIISDDNSKIVSLWLKNSIPGWKYSVSLKRVRVDDSSDTMSEPFNNRWKVLLYLTDYSDLVKRMGNSCFF